MLKTYLRTCIDSFFLKPVNKERMANASMPSNGQITIPVTVSENSVQVSYTATADGWVYASVRGLASGLASIEINHTDNGPFGARTFLHPNSTGIMRLIFPVRKGRTISISGSNVQTDFTASFRYANGTTPT